MQKRLMEASMSSVDLCHRSGSGSSLTASMYLAIARFSSVAAAIGERHPG